MNKKIVFLTFHNWETKRQGGFHKFAEYMCNIGSEITFFSFSRPYYIYFLKTERLNKRVLLNLIKGKKYTLDKNYLLNITFPTLSLPGPLRKFVSNKMDFFLQVISFKSFKKFGKKYFTDTDYFIFESNESILLFDKIKKQFPKSKLIYRPSDPLLQESGISYLGQFEKRIICECDLVLIVNKEGLNLYKKKISNFDSIVNYKLLSNGVDFKSYKRKHPIPKLYQNISEKIAVYVGARDPEWSVIIEASKQLTSIKFVIVCPNKPNRTIFNIINNISNVIYVEGIPPKYVPAFITNSDIVIVPNPNNRYKYRKWGITAKYYQAMAAKKPIVAYHDTLDLKEIGIPVVYDCESFIAEIKLGIKTRSMEYNFNLEDRSWNNVCKDFNNYINSI